MSETKGTSDEAIGRPKDWREGRYQQPGKPVDVAVNNPAQSEGEPLDPMGTQTPPQAARHEERVLDPRDRPVTRKDYEELQPPPADRR